MTPYHYTDPEHESEPHALPDVEVFHQDEQPGCCAENLRYGRPACCLAGDGPGWYWASGFPGCLWDSDPIGPFDTEAEALADARGE
jgi:hypothetical protein